MNPLLSWRTLVRALGAALALSVLGAGPLALAQAQAQAQSADPPGRVARLSEFDGTVTYAPAGTGDWRYANRNRPLTTGDAVWVERNSRAEMHVGGTAVRMGASTSLTLSALTDQNVQLNVTQGTVACACAVSIRTSPTRSTRRTWRSCRRRPASIASTSIRTA
ncbi:hypothetical protein AB870_26050 [Pandoraea faecigallinarum]|uniref:FecR protein domain-containing protein n=1 Tax=Pandoraea faecigallinarum TaxID=656179 RepID=A0A173H012_9BURK|nr:hypothetical protein [Pandoraea faecigallinarum]ANI21779.1 hypothetical protein AB870_26050 [Pandoraea faecigallinarum]